MGPKRSNTGLEGEGCAVGMRFVWIPSSNGGGEVECGISDCAVVVAAENQVSCDLVGEAVMLDLKSSVYYVYYMAWMLLEPRSGI
jgi:hypothetical protein